MATGTIEVLTDRFQGLKTEILGQAIVAGDFYVTTKYSNFQSIDATEGTGKATAKDFYVDLHEEGWIVLMTNPFITGESGSWASFCTMSNNRRMNEGETYAATIRNNKGDLAAYVRLGVQTLYVRNKGA